MSAPDFSGGGIGEPATNGFAVTPDDVSDLPAQTRALYVGGAGNVRVTLRNGDVLTFVGATAGSYHPIRASRVWSTGTTATSIVGLY